MSVGTEKRLSPNSGISVLIQPIGDFWKRTVFSAKMTNRFIKELLVFRVVGPVEMRYDDIEVKRGVN